MQSFDRELQTALAAVQRARSSVAALDRGGLDRQQKRALRLLVNRLGDAARGVAEPFEPAYRRVYVETRAALSQIDRVERGPLTAGQREVLGDAVRALHEAEYALHDAFWRGV
jgi:hypothetical protein